MRLKAIGVISFILIGFALHSQQVHKTADRQKWKYLQVSLGTTQQQEKNLVLVTHNGYGASIIYGKEKWGKNVQSYSISIGASKSKTTFEDAAQSISLNARFQFDYLLHLKSKQGWQQYIGPFARLHYTVAYYSNWDESHLYWTDYLGLGAKSATVYRLKEQKDLMATFELPIFSLLSRPTGNRQKKFDDFSASGLLHQFHSNVQAGSLQQLIDFNLSLAYRIAFAKKRAESIGYSFTSLRARGYQDRGALQQHHSIFLTYYF